MISSFTWRTVSAEAIFTPSIVTLVSRGSVPRTWTYFPSPSSRSSVTLGSRPIASAMLAFGRLLITSAGSTLMMLSALNVRLIDSISPPSRPAYTWTSCLLDATLSDASSRADCPAITVTFFVNGANPAYEMVTS
jgi:hypothetical protein